MPTLAELGAPIALMLPALGAETAAGDVSTHAAAFPVAIAAQAEGSSAISAPDQGSEQHSDAKAPASALDAFYSGQRVRQTRIESRIIIRISPQRSGTRRNMLAQLPQRTLSTRYKEQKAKKCLKVNDIAGVQTGSGNRLLLFLRDSKIMSVNLEKACRARDFYSGFYVERAEDGKVCVDRDQLQSRNGARCEIDRMMRLVAIKD
ncbi:MAG: hypothetical protein SXU28_06895 [Pseudomonadota bacterium]|nr:hypothetical protein [Pseudomonadota bacterium]